MTRLLLFLLVPCALGAQSIVPPWSFEGQWGAADLNSRSITGATISRAGDEWFLDVTGACAPTDCKWPRTALTRVSDDRAVANQFGAMTLTRDGADLLIDQVRTGSATIHVRLVRRTQGTAAGASPEDAVRSGYAREFGVSVERPAIYFPKASCGGEQHVTSTAYLKTSADTSTVLVIFMSRDGKTFIGRSSRSYLTPAGTIRMLSVVVRYPETIGENAPALWKDAQAQINRDHEAFARARGYKAPVVAFDNTNVFVDRAEIGDPKNASSVRATAARHGLRATDYQIVTAVDMNPDISAGGFSLTLPERFIYMGNFSNWRAPLGETEWRQVARAVYHHEMAHHWGWPGTHDWTLGCEPERTEDWRPFIVPPMLFGWEDLRGDHIPEILRTSK